ncbi:MAG: prolipoprotein diacylglyceryl transferase [Flavobacteriaceae bacterium]|nr:prolipoprotein diacylglyceryl transferase [Flavobacteriaceae bacterium]
MEYFVWDINPILFKLGGVEVRWYGVCFALAIMFGYMIGGWIFKREGNDEELIDPLLYYLVVGIILGARLGHCLFYEPSIYLSDPIRILKVWEGGLASHGAVLGIFLSIFIFTKRHKEFSFLGLLDMLTIPSMIAAAMIRLGNFFNSEIIGTTTEVPWAIIFKRVSISPRHPVQLYEAISYLLVFILFLFLYTKTKLIKKSGALLGLLLSLVFSIRFLLEFVKNKQSEFEGLTVSVGQWLSLPLILFGLVLFIYKMKSSKTV